MHRDNLPIPTISRSQTYSDNFHFPSKFPGLSNEFSFQKKLGSGAFATVYEIVDKNQNISMACKVTRVSENAIEEDRQNQKAERRKLSAMTPREISMEMCFLEQLKHENIASMETALFSHDHIFIVSEKYNSDLEKAQIHGRWSFDHVGFVVAQVTMALLHAHSWGVAHRDLKPQNVFWTAYTNNQVPVGSPDHRFPRAVLGDFGLAKRCTNDTWGMTETAGSLQYLAPEQLRKYVKEDSSIPIRRNSVFAAKSLGKFSMGAINGQPLLSPQISPAQPAVYGNNLHVANRDPIAIPPSISRENSTQQSGYGRQADLWSLGIFLYYLLFGIEPYRCMPHVIDERSLAKAIVSGPPPIPANPLACWTTTSSRTGIAADLCSRLLVSDPSKRLSAYEALKHPFLRPYVTRIPWAVRTIKEAKWRLAGMNETPPVLPVLPPTPITQSFVDAYKNFKGIPGMNGNSNQSNAAVVERRQIVAPNINIHMANTNNTNNNNNNNNNNINNNNITSPTLSPTMPNYITTSNINNPTMSSNKALSSQHLEARTPTTFSPSSFAEYNNNNNDTNINNSNSNNNNNHQRTNSYHQHFPPTAEKLVSPTYYNNSQFHNEASFSPPSRAVSIERSPISRLTSVVSPSPTANPSPMGTVSSPNVPPAASSFCASHSYFSSNDPPVKLATRSPQPSLAERLRAVPANSNANNSPTALAPPFGTAQQRRPSHQTNVVSSPASTYMTNGATTPRKTHHGTVVNSNNAFGMSVGNIPLEGDNESILELDCVSEDEQYSTPVLNLYHHQYNNSNRNNNNNNNKNNINNVNVTSSSVIHKKKGDINVLLSGSSIANHSVDKTIDSQKHLRMLTAQKEYSLPATQSKRASSANNSKFNNSIKNEHNWNSSINDIVLTTESSVVFSSGRECIFSSNSESNNILGSSFPRRKRRHSTIKGSYSHYNAENAEVRSSTNLNNNNNNNNNVRLDVPTYPPQLVSRDYSVDPPYFYNDHNMTVMNNNNVNNVFSNSGSTTTTSTAGQQHNQPQQFHRSTMRKTSFSPPRHSSNRADVALKVQRQISPASSAILSGASSSNLNTNNYGNNNIHNSGSNNASVNTSGNNVRSSLKNNNYATNSNFNIRKGINQHINSMNA